MANLSNNEQPVRERSVSIRVGKVEIIIAMVAIFLAGSLLVAIIGPFLTFVLSAALCILVAVLAFANRGSIGMAWACVPTVFAILWLTSAALVPDPTIFPHGATASERQYEDSSSEGR